MRIFSAKVLVVLIFLGLPFAAIAQDAAIPPTIPASNTGIDAASAASADAPDAVAPLSVSPPPAAPAPKPLTRPTLVDAGQISAGDTAWLMSATALILLMTIPGLALFYTGMVRKKNA